MSKYEVGADERTGYERMKGRPCFHEIVEFGDKAHHKNRKGGRWQKEKLERKRGPVRVRREATFRRIGTGGVSRDSLGFGLGAGILVHMHSAEIFMFAS